MLLYCKICSDTHTSYILHLPLTVAVPEGPYDSEKPFFIEKMKHGKFIFILFLSLEAL